MTGPSPILIDAVVFSAYTFSVAKLQKVDKDNTGEIRRLQLSAIEVIHNVVFFQWTPIHV